MNWMTSGRHRALRTKRGKKRSEMHFPAHVQREVARVRRHPLAQTDSGDSRHREGTAWYIRSVLDDNQSHDIQMLEMAREAATGRTEDSTGRRRQTPEEKNEIQAPEAGNKAETKKIGERRCVFTPVKANRQRPRATEQVNPRAAKRPLSPLPRDLLLFNEGEQIARPASSRAATTLPVSSQRRQTQDSSPKTVNSRLDEDSAREKAKNRFLDPIEQGKKLPRQANSLPFYAGSSSSEDEAPASINYGRGADFERATLEAGGGLTTGRAPHDVRQLDEPRQQRMNLFQSIEQEIQTKLIQRARHSDLSGEKGEFTLHTKRESQPLKKLSTLESQPVQGLPTRRLPFENLRSATSSRSDCEEYGAQDSKRQRCISSTPQVGCERRGTPKSPSIEEYEDSKSHESTSSQGSLDLPPPVDWQKRLITHVDEKDQIQPPRASGPRHEDYVEDGSSGSQTSSKWTMSSRTRAVFSRLIEKELVIVDESVVLEQRLQEAEAVAVYLFTLVQCHKIDEECRSNALAPSAGEGMSDPDSPMKQPIS